MIRAKECFDFEQKMKEQIEKIQGGQIHIETLSQMYSWVNETKPKLD